MVQLRAWVCAGGDYKSRSGDWGTIVPPSAEKIPPPPHPLPRKRHPRGEGVVFRKNHPRAEGKVYPTRPEKEGGKRGVKTPLSPWDFREKGIFTEQALEIEIGIGTIGLGWG